MLAHALFYVFGPLYMASKVAPKSLELENFRTVLSSFESQEVDPSQEPELFSIKHKMQLWDSLGISVKNIM